MTHADFKTSLSFSWTTSCWINGQSLAQWRTPHWKLHLSSPEEAPRSSETPYSGMHPRERAFISWAECSWEICSMNSDDHKIHAIGVNEPLEHALFVPMFLSCYLIFCTSYLVTCKNWKMLLITQNTLYINISVLLLLYRKCSIEKSKK